MTFNPFDIQKQVMAEFEKNLGQYMEKTMREPEFMKMVSKSMEASLDMRGLLKKHLGPVLKSMDIPTGDALAGLYKTVHDVETRLLDLEERVDELQEQLKNARRAESAEKKAERPAAAKRKAK